MFQVFTPQRIKEFELVLDTNLEIQSLNLSPLVYVISERVNNIEESMPFILHTFLYSWMRLGPRTELIRIF